MSRPVIGLLVSGVTEVEALPILIRRLLQERHARYDIAWGQKKDGTLLRKPESSLLKVNDDTLERASRRVLRRADALLVLVDLEDDCPAVVGPSFQARVDAIAPDKPAQVVCAYREFETWFLYDAAALFGVPPVDDPERKRDSKKWIRALTGKPYDQVLEGPPLCRQLDIEHVRQRSDSFRVLCERVEVLVSALT